MGKVIINQEKCKACYLCLAVCPKKALEISKTLNKRGCYPIIFDEEKGCTGCAMCALSCPDLAIEKVHK